MAQATEEMVPVDRIFLDLKNPRHKRLREESQAIKFLCEREKILPLARDIAVHGLNPLSRFALAREGDGYVAIDGNRRVCALRLLHDPDRAPREYMHRFQDAARGWDPIEELPAVVFGNRSDVDLWLERMHAGSAGGIGQVEWDAEQKARHTGADKNVVAQKILDAAEKASLITSRQREGRLSTVQRYAANPEVKEALGLVVTDKTEVAINLPQSDFLMVFGRFVADIRERRINTRAKAAEMREYAQQLKDLPGLSGKRTKPRSLEKSESVDEPPPKPTPPRPPTRISFSKDLECALIATGVYKLHRIYYSLCKISLANHTPLLTVGAWVFIETLTAAAGRNQNTDFHSFLSPNKLEKLGLGKGQKMKAARAAVKRISDLGNSTKHDEVAASFNSETLANDFDAIERLLIALARDVANTRSP